MTTRVPALVDLGRVAFGAYRVRRGNSTHRAALEAALRAGVRVVDTASTYTDGESERLVGEVVDDHPDLQPFVVTKVGYVGPALRAELSARSKDHLLHRDATHSLDPEVLRVGVELSLARLGTGRVDAVLLHNPEKSLLDDDVDEIVPALELMEELVAAGVVGCHGLSTHSLPTSDRGSSGASLPGILRAAHRLAPVSSLRILGAPANLLEPGARLVELGRAWGLHTMAHRPMNALGPSGPVRLATPRPVDPEREEEVRSAVHSAVATALARQGVARDVFDFPAMRFVRDAVFAVPHADLVDDVFHRRIFPLVRALWGVPPPEVAALFAELHDLSCRRAGRLTAGDTSSVRAELVRSGILATDDDRPLSVIACEHPLLTGFDQVVVGMRRPEYVSDLAELLRPAVRASRAP